MRQRAFYLVKAYDRIGMGEKWEVLRQSHIDHWNGYGDAVAAAGAIMSGDADDAVPIGSMLIVQANDRAAAAEMLAHDPFTLQGVFSENVEIRRWRLGLGRWIGQ